MLTLIAIAAFLATLLGGLFALKLKDKLHLILGFSAGAVIAVAFFDLMPEALNLANASGIQSFSNSTILSITALGFLIYLLLDRVIFLHGHSHEDDHSHTEETHVQPHVQPHVKKGILGAGSLCLHSFLDGIAIGLAFQVNPTIGIIVAVAVLIHDFSDGINTVGIILRGQIGNVGQSNIGASESSSLAVKSKTAFTWLIADAIAPVLGIVATLFFSIPEKNLSIIIALFAGFFLYIGASDLIPESHHAHPKLLTTLMTILGAGVLYVAIKLAGI